MSKLLNVSSSPHVRDQVTTSNIMLDVAIAMIPATAYGVYQFGIKAALVILATVLSCVLSEYVYETLMGKPVTISDGSALVTGMILALNMPPEHPAVDSGTGRYLRYYCCKAVIRRPWPELHEPGSGGQMFLTYCICGQDDYLHIQRRGSKPHTARSLKGRPGSGYSGHVHR